MFPEILLSFMSWLQLPRHLLWSLDRWQTDGTLADIRHGPLGDGVAELLDPLLVPGRVEGYEGLPGLADPQSLFQKRLGPWIAPGTQDDHLDRVEEALHRHGVGRGEPAVVLVLPGKGL